MNGEDSKKGRFVGDGDPAVERLAAQVIDAALAVHRALGPGFVESVYERALAKELEVRGIAHCRQVSVRIWYRGEEVGEHRLDFLIGQQVVVELKAVEKLSLLHVQQLRSYLKATDCQLGLLMNFNAPLLRDGLRRVALPNPKIFPSSIFPLQEEDQEKD